jgi:alkylated DNA repair dioxygenase AlkB
MYQPHLFDGPLVDNAPEVLVDRDGLITYDRYFLEPRVADHLFHSLLGGTDWQQEFLRMYGKRIPFPRLTAWYGDADAVYKYSGVSNKPLPWTGELKEIRDALVRRTGVRFNSVLLNQYRTGEDSLSWHADNEPELGVKPIIASVSLGAIRSFDLRHIDGAKISVDLEHGSLLLMSGDLQRYWRHRVPKERNVSSPRINLTFRVVDAKRNDPEIIPTRRTSRSRKT